MSDYISINVQECEPAQSVHHSARTKTVTYLVSNPSTITTFRHDLDSLNHAQNEINDVADYFKSRTEDIKQDYKENNNRALQKNTKLYQEAVISFGRERFEKNNQDDILKATEDFCNDFELKYNVKILMTSLHLDEGHKDDTGKIQHNYHAHLLIENYSFDTHKTGMRKVDYRKLQTELAESFEHLGFVRGDPEKKTERLEHREYRAKKEQETKREIELVDTKAQLAKLEAEYKQARQELKDSKIAKQADYQELKRQYEEQKAQLAIKNKEISIIQNELEKTKTHDMLFDEVLYDRIFAKYKREQTNRGFVFASNFELSAKYLTDLCLRADETKYQEIYEEALKLPRTESEEYLSKTRLDLIREKGEKEDPKEEEKGFFKFFSQKNDELQKNLQNLQKEVEELHEVVAQLSAENNQLRAKVPTDTPPAPEVEKILQEYEKKQFSWDLKRDYKDVQEALKLTGLARQQDYSTAKNIYHDKLEKENGSISERNLNLTIKIKDLEAKPTSQLIQSPTPTQEKPIEREKTISMAELKPLERVIGAFASVSEMLEKLLEKIGNLTKTIENQKLELNELHSEKEQLRDELEEYKSNEIEFEM